MQRDGAGLAGVPAGWLPVYLFPESRVLAWPLLAHFKLKCCLYLYLLEEFALCTVSIDAITGNTILTQYIEV